MNRRAERHVGPGEKKSPPFTKRTREMNQQYWRANNRYIHIREIDEKGYIYLKSQAFSTLNLPQRLGSIRRSWLSLDKSIGEFSMVYKKTSALIRPGVSACNQFNSTRFVQSIPDTPPLSDSRMSCDMQISQEMVSNAHVHQLTVSL